MKQQKRISKGAPSGLVISLALHAAAFFVAGIVVVISIKHPRKEPFVVPPPIVRHSMQLIKPKVKVQKSAQPKPSARIVAQVKSRDLPEILLPNVSGAGKGLLEGTGIGDVCMDIPDVKILPTPFGDRDPTGNDLEGRFYDFKRNARGLIRSVTADPGTVPNDVDNIIHNFMKRGWNPSALSDFYCAPKTLYSSCVCIGTVQSTLAPEAFGETETDGYAWAVLYKGTLVYPEDITFRFRGVGDKFMGVRVDGRVVMLAVYNSSVRQFFSDIWTSSAPDHRLYPMGEGKQAVGDWITLKAGEPVDIEILLGDRHGGLVYHQLVVEVEGEEYPRNPFGGGPTLPVFKTDNLTRAQLDALCLDVYPGDVNLTNGPVFCDYVPAPADVPEADQSVMPVLLADEVSAMRTWSDYNGGQVTGRLLLQAEDYVLIEKEDGRQQKIELALLSAADRQFMELAAAPEFKVEFIKTSDQVHPTTLSPYDNGRPLSILDYVFGAKLKWSSSDASYAHPLTVEYFAVGREVNGDNYILLDHDSESFVPAGESTRRFAVEGRSVRLKKYANRYGCPMRGRKEKGYLVVVTDSLGRVVQYKASNEFLFEHLPKLRRLPVNAHFDDHCVRHYPSRPVDADRADWILMAGAN